MSLLPVIERELRVAARNRHTYRLRFLAAAGAIGVTFWTFFTLTRYGYIESAVGGRLFSNVTTIALFVALLAGVFQTADTISQERREGTFGLLYLTDLRCSHVVFGKLLAASIPSFFAALTIMPILAIPVLMGGITGGEIARASMSLAVAVALALTAGLFASCLAQDDKITRLLTIFIMTALIALPLLLSQNKFSPLWVLQHASFGAFNQAPAEFWNAIILQSALALVFAAMAAFAARAIWRERPASAAMQRWQQRWREWSQDGANESQAWRREMLEKNPAIWLAARRRARSALLWVLIGAGALVVMWSWVKFRRLDPVLMLPLSALYHMILKTVFALGAARSLADEVRSGALELLFTTPLTPLQVVTGNLIALLRSFGPAAAVAILFDAAWIAFGRADKEFSDELPGFLWARIGFLVLDLFTISIYATWLGFKKRSPGLAAFQALAIVVVLPDALWIFGFQAIGVGGFLEIFLTWLAIDVFLIVSTLPKFAQVRRLTAERFSASSGRE